MTIDKLRLLLSTTGPPEEIVSDNDPQFTSSEFKEFTRLNGIKHTLVPPYNPQSNGFAERGVQIIKKALNSKEVDGKQHSLEHKLTDILLKYRTTPHTTTGVAPAELLMKRQHRTRVSLLKPSIGTREEDHQQNMKINHYKGHCNVRKFQMGGKVQVKYTVQAGKWKWLPGSIHK
jgi:transposase InsO family protein